jgi:hypothetical protein
MRTARSEMDVVDISIGNKKQIESKVAELGLAFRFF